MNLKYDNLPYFSADDYIKRVKESSFAGKFKEEVFSQNWYAAFCNNAFLVDGTHVYSVSWRSSGGDVADIRNELNYGSGEDYLDWYCSGIGHSEDTVPEATITDEVTACLKEIGFELIPDYYNYD